ncbi:MAG: Tab2/Atab2 family RNA-binding protein [Microcoleaceae cyanobacterium]
MLIWQADCYRRPLQDPTGQPLWELLICDMVRSFEFVAFCPQAQVNSSWLKQQVQAAIQRQQQTPDMIQVFRPQCLNLITQASQTWGILVQPNRHTEPLKQWLQERAQLYPQFETYTGAAYEPLALDRPPPVPLPENLWGDRWRFASLSAGELIDGFADRPIPILELPEALLPLNLGLASIVPIPGIVIDGGRQSRRLAQWVQATRPFALNYVPGSPDGLILEAGLVDRWILVTFEDLEITQAAKSYQQRRQSAQGLHFLLVQPDDSGVTYSGFWLLSA